MSRARERVLRYILENPGATAADVTRATWGGRGHAATYDVVRRAARAGLVTRTQIGNSYALTITAAGMEALS